jgi:hypothetical protein
MTQVENLCYERHTQVENLCYERHTQVANLCYERHTQVANLCYERQRGAARAREPALLSPRSQDGEAEKASSERRAGCP